MRVYECGSWKWRKGQLPTNYNAFNDSTKETCIEAGVDYYFGQFGQFGYASKEGYIKNNWKVISPEEFYKIEKVFPEKRKEINEDFDTNSK